MNTDDAVVDSETIKDFYVKYFDQNFYVNKYSMDETFPNIVVDFEVFLNICVKL